MVLVISGVFLCPGVGFVQPGTIHIYHSELKTPCR